MACLLRSARMALHVSLRTTNLMKRSHQMIPSLVNQARLYSATSTMPDLKYTESHEWLKVEGNTCTVGLTEHAQDSLGDIVFVELPEDGAELEQEADCGVVESVKAVSQIYCPVTGTVAATNQNVIENPSLINESCYDEGWLFKIEMSKPDELDGLLSEEAYQNFIQEEE